MILLYLANVQECSVNTFFHFMPPNAIKKEDQERGKGDLGLKPREQHTANLTAASFPCRESLRPIGLENNWKLEGQEQEYMKGKCW